MTNKPDDTGLCQCGHHADTHVHHPEATTRRCLATIEDDRSRPDDGAPFLTSCPCLDFTNDSRQGPR